jgi:hypothetical protein
MENGDGDREYVIGDWGSDGNEAVAVRNHEWKYIARLNADNSREEELYYLADDPGEHDNLENDDSATRNRFRDIVEEHRRAIAATETDLGTVKMENEVKARLRDLGYKE